MTKRISNTLHAVMRGASAIALGVAVMASGAAAQQQRTVLGERYIPTIWVDPDGCEHWVMDDGAERSLTPLSAIPTAAPRMNITWAFRSGGPILWRQLHEAPGPVSRMCVAMANGCPRRRTTPPRAWRRIAVSKSCAGAEGAEL